MRIRSSILAVGRYALALFAAAGSLVLMSAPKKTGFTVHDKAYFADPSTVNFVRPGFNITIVSGKIATDGTISVDYKLSDPDGLPLDITGVTTPGTISISYLAAYVPKGQAQFVSYVTRIETDALYNTGRQTTQATGDSGGTRQTVATGEYIYTFKTKAPANFDATATHRIGVYGSRNLTEFDLGTNYYDATFDFVPGGGTPAPRDVVRTADCDKCHDSLAAHGGSRKSVQLCIICHTPQTSDAETNNTLDFKVFIHKLHHGSGLPSVAAGKPYQIVGFQNSVNDWSTVRFPSHMGDVRDCAGTCHNPKNGAAQTTAWYSNPNQAACGSCHDNVNFATGQNHVNLPQVDDNQCKQCHIPKGELEFDASVMGAHTIPQLSASAPGINLGLVRVDNGAPGRKPTVTFTIKDNSGAAIPMSAMTGGSNRLALVLVGPTSDYGYTNFGADVTTNGYVSENPVPTAQCASDGTCTYTFTHAIPANATGSYAVGIEGRRGLTILPGTTQEQTTEYGADNKVLYFSVDGSKAVPRRTVVATANCNNCHTRLSLHGENRNQVEMCVICHNPSENDSAYKSVAQVPADKTSPPQAINFAMMIHKIHTGEHLADFGATYVIVGFGGSHNDFGDIRYPTMGPTGTTGDTAKCDMCHVNNSEQVFPIGKNAVTDPQGKVSPVAATTSACSACHLNTSALAHALSQTDPKFGESCDVCHGAGAAFDVLLVHAGK